MEIDVFTLFPEAFEWFHSQRHIQNALASGHRVSYVNPREHTPLSAGQVDDTPFGGGAGMVLRVDVMEAALRARYGVDPVEGADPADLASRRRILALTPGGRLLDDELVDELAAEPALTLLCGRYEGFDERILEHFATDRLSIGRYVLAGGELAAMVVCDAVLRKLPGSLGHVDSAHEESFSRALDGAPEYPHYTRPAEFRGWPVPEILLSGHHARIREWRLEQARTRAQERSLP
jgi:tRNA (guanine37-N1)-methyltransferase